MEEKLKEYFLKLGYNPYHLESLDDINILHRSRLSTIFQEVIDTTETYDYVRKVRLNLLYRSMAKKSQDARNKQKNRWYKKIELEEKSETTNIEINELRNSIGKDVAKLKNLKLEKEQLAAKIQKNAQKKQLYKQKSEQLKNLIENRKMKIKNAQTIVPTNSFKTVELPDILQTIRQIAKLSEQNKRVISGVPSMYLTPNRNRSTDRFDKNGDEYGISVAQHVAIRTMLKEKFPITCVTSVLHFLKQMQLYELSQITNLVADISSTCMQDAKTSLFNVEDELAQLSDYYLTIQLETKRIQASNVRKEALINDYLTKIEDDDTYTWVYNNLMEMGLRAGCEVLRKEICSMQKIGQQNSENNTQQYIKTISDIHFDIENIKYVVETKFHELSTLQFRVSNSLQLLNNANETFLANINCMSPHIPQEFDHTTEIQMFQNYSLNHHSINSLNISNTFDLLVNANQKTTANQIILHIFDTPITRPEVVIWNIFWKKVYLEMRQKNRSDPTLMIENHLEICTPKNLEHLRQSAKNHLKVLSKFSSDCYGLEMFCSQLNLAFNFWKEQTWKTAIAKSRLFDGKNLEYYDNKYNSLYETLTKLRQKKNCNLIKRT